MQPSKPIFQDELKSIGTKEKPQNSPELECFLSIEPVESKKIIYYSDFDIDINDWKKEEEHLGIFFNTLLEILGMLFYIYNRRRLYRISIQSIITKHNLH